MEHAPVVRPVGDLHRGKEWGWGFAGIPPGGETALGIGIDDGHRTRIGALGFDSQVGGQGGFSRTAHL
jgi:hypothetical protein